MGGGVPVLHVGRGLFSFVASIICTYPYIYILGKKNTDTQAELYIYYFVIRVPLLLLPLLLLVVGSDSI